MNILLTHPGTQYAPRLAAALHQQRILSRFATGIAFADDPDTLIRKTARVFKREKLLLKRVVPGLPAEKLHLQPLKEAIALFRHQVLGQSNDAVFYPRNIAFQQQLPQRLIEEADAVIGFDTSSWILAGRCRKAGKPFILDVSIAHPLSKEKAFAKLREAYPQWAAELAPKTQRNIEVELEEIEKADHIVVASSFTRNTYIENGVAAEKISVNPYGTDVGNVIPIAIGSETSEVKGERSNVKRETSEVKGDSDRPDSYRDLKSKVKGEMLEVKGDSDSYWKSNGKQIATAKGKGAGEMGTSNPKPATFLFFGALSARKGFPWLCEVWKNFYAEHPGCRLLAAGYDFRPDGFSIPEGMEVLGAIHPKDRTALFAAADVFVFPSFFEGFGQVILEAMNCGLPVITTTATAGPDLWQNDVPHSLIVPGDDAGLLQAMQYYANHPEGWNFTGRLLQKEASAFTWQAYGDRWRNICQQVLDSR